MRHLDQRCSLRVGSAPTWRPLHPIAPAWLQTRTSPNPLRTPPYHSPRARISRRGNAARDGRLPLRNRARKWGRKLSPSSPLGPSRPCAGRRSRFSSCSQWGRESIGSSCARTLSLPPGPGRSGSAGSRADPIERVVGIVRDVNYRRAGGLRLELCLLGRVLLEARNEPQLVRADAKLQEPAHRAGGTLGAVRQPSCSAGDTLKLKGLNWLLR